MANGNKICARCPRFLILGCCAGLCCFGFGYPAFALQSPAANETTQPVAATPAANVTGATASGDPIDLSFDNLKFDLAKGAEFKPELLTDEIKKLDGKQIRLRGYVRPGFKQSGIKNFVLVRDNQECCFGPGAALYDCVMVKMAEDQAIDFTVRPITIVGKFQIKEYIGKDKKTWAIYRMTESRQE
jgi:hypothetical protein